jgi:hypothetical protein
MSRKALLEGLSACISMFQDAVLNIDLNELQLINENIIEELKYVTKKPHVFQIKRKNKRLSTPYYKRLEEPEKDFGEFEAVKKANRAIER